MSHITDVIIHGANVMAIEDLNDWMSGKDSEEAQQFKEIDMSGAGGRKAFTGPVWAASLNYAPSGLAEKLRDPDTWGNQALCVMVMVDSEDYQEVTMFTCGADNITTSMTLSRFDYDPIEVLGA